MLVPGLLSAACIWKAQRVRIGLPSCLGAGSLSGLGSDSRAAQQSAPPEKAKPCSPNLEDPEARGVHPILTCCFALCCTQALRLVHSLTCLNRRSSTPHAEPVYLRDSQRGLCPCPSCACGSDTLPCLCLAVGPDPLLSVDDGGEKARVNQHLSNGLGCARLAGFQHHSATSTHVADERDKASSSSAVPGRSHPILTNVAIGVGKSHCKVFLCVRFRMLRVTWCSLCDHLSERDTLGHARESNASLIAAFGSDIRVVKSRQRRV